MNGFICSSLPSPIPIEILICFKIGCVDFGLDFYLVGWFGFLLWVFSKAKSAACAL